MTNVAKCNVCNIIIDEMLSYIQNKVSIIDEESLVRICKAAFTSDEIKNSKSLLFASIPTDIKKILRKNKGKEERDVTDIINLFKSTEPDIIPIFVARQLDKLPPILIDHLDCSKLLKDMQVLKAEIEGIKSTYATLESVNKLKTDVLRVKNDSLPPTSAFKVNTRRGAWLDSGPIGLSHDCHNLSDELDVNSKNLESSNIRSPLPQYREMRVVEEKQTDHESSERQRSVEYRLASAGGDRRSSLPRHKASAGADCGAEGERLSVSQEASARTGSVPSAALTSDAPSMPVQIADQLTVAVNDGHSLQQPVSVCETTTKANSNEGWQRVVHRKRLAKYRFVGKSGVARDLECTFRGADRKIPMFITNVHISTIESDIIKHIYNKTLETVSLEKINMKFERGHKAYKFFISEANLSRYMDETLWPAGVLFRRFVNFKHRISNGAHLTGANGPNKPNNG